MFRLDAARFPPCDAAAVHWKLQVKTRITCSLCWMVKRLHDCPLKKTSKSIISTGEFCPAEGRRSLSAMVSSSSHCDRLVTSTTPSLKEPRRGKSMYNLHPSASTLNKTTLVSVALILFHFNERQLLRRKIKARQDQLMELEKKRTQ